MSKFTDLILVALLLSPLDSMSAVEPSPGGSAIQTYERRVESVRQTPGLVAFWDFVQREDGLHGSGKFLAYTARGDDHRYVLEPHNISRDFWCDGAEATLADFPLLGRGPFGQAVQFRKPKTKNDLPVLLVPRAVLHDTPLDIKGPGKSVSMVIWLIYQEGDHAIAGIWHEGTDTPGVKEPAAVQEQGRRQFGMFAGLAANPGGVSAHISENGVASFGDRYARHLAATPEKMRRIKSEATPVELDAGWSAVGFVFDCDKQDVTSYLDGMATEFWIENPANHPFYKYAARAWRQAKLAKLPSSQLGVGSGFSPDQFYNPPENQPLSEKVVSETADKRIVIRTYEFTKVRVTFHKDGGGKLSDIASTELVALKANPYWFGHDIYAPRTLAEGGPFTIGRVIHSNRHATLSAYIGGVAVFNRPLSAEEMARLSAIGHDEPITPP